MQDNAPEGRIIFSEKFACPVSGFTIAEIEPRLFSFNAPQGACPGCDGLGEKQLFDPDLIVPNEALSIKKGAVVPWARSNPPSPYYMQVLGSLAREFGFSLETPWKDLPQEVHDIILYGTKGRPVTLRFIDGRKSLRGEEAVRRRDRQPQPPHAPDRKRLDARGAQQISERRPLRDLRRRPPPPRAARGQDRRRAYQPGHRPLASATRSPGSRRSTAKLNPTQNEIARAILKEINERLGFLNNVGLDYLDLNRTSGTLSGGESQRIRLASQIGSGLSGVLYVLDEP